MEALRVPREPDDDSKPPSLGGFILERTFSVGEGSTSELVHKIKNLRVSGRLVELKVVPDGIYLKGFADENGEL